MLNLDIVVNGMPLKKVGDTVYCVLFQGAFGRPYVKADTVIKKIQIDENGINYLDEDNISLKEHECNTFFSKESAEKWIADNVPEKYVYKKDDEIFIIRKGRIIPLYAANVGMYSKNRQFDDETFAYRFEDAFDSAYYVFENNGKIRDSFDREYTIFTSYEQASLLTNTQKRKLQNTEV